MQMTEVYQGIFFPSQKLGTVYSMCIERHRKDSPYLLSLSCLFCTQIKGRDTRGKVGQKGLTKKFQNPLTGGLRGKWVRYAPSMKGHHLGFLQASLVLMVHLESLGHEVPARKQEESQHIGTLAHAAGRQLRRS